MSGNQPILRIQTASLYASGDTSRFTGTGGPVGYEPFLSGFSGTIDATNLASVPFADKVYNVDAGDQVVFVIAVENFAAYASAFNITLRNSVPAGFIVPIDGGGLTVVNGGGASLAYSGDLFDPNGGLTISSPISAFDSSTGFNIALVTFTLQATNSIAVPLTDLSDAATIVSYAAEPSGANLAGSSGTSLTATTALQTNGISVTSTAEQTVPVLASGQTIAYDITVTLPEGTLQDLRIDQATPVSGTAGFQLVSAEIVQVGANITATAPIFVQPSGLIALGTVTNAYDNLQTVADQIVIRVTVANGGAGAGTGALNTTVSAADPNHPGQRWTTTVTNTQLLAKPNTPPSIFGVSASQSTVAGSPVLPLAGLLFADPDPGQTDTLTIHLSDATLGTWSGATGTTNPAGDIVLTGSMDQVQAAARSLVFTPAPGASGTENVALSLSDGFATVTNASTNLVIAPVVNASDLVHFPISALTVLTSTPFGSTTLAQVENYAGPLDNIQSQFLYEGVSPLAIVAQQTSMLFSSRASATAVQVLGGANVLNMEQGSSFLVGGAGNDVFILHAEQPQPTWNTIANFHPGDSITIYGFHGGVSTDRWVADIGAPGWTGATLHMDLNNDHVVDSSLTFAGKSLADTNHFNLSTGNVAGQDYLLITAV